jgi:syndecan 4
MDYSGTWFVNTDEGHDYIGFVFGYQSNRKFYLVTWRQENYNYGGTAYRGGVRGIQIKVWKYINDGKSTVKWTFSH